MTSPISRWSNWAGNQRATGVTVHHPRGTAEIAATVARVRSGGGRLKAIGSGHSFTAIGRPEGHQVAFDRHAGLVALDRATGLVTVEAGMTIRTLNAILRQAGLSMTNLGDIDKQTVSGAVSTGTHGTGATFGGIATQIRGLELVVADGTVLTCTAKENPEVFAAARVGLGALGLISTVTFQTEPAFAICAEEGPMPLDEVLSGLDALADGTDHFEFYWFPHTEVALTKRNTRLPYDTPLSPLPRWKTMVDDELLSNVAFAGVIGLSRRVPAGIPRLNQLTARALGARTFTDYSSEIFVSARRVRFVEMEYAVPRADLAAVVTEIRSMIESTGLRIPFPIEVRVAAADNIALSTAAGRESGYVAVHLPIGTDFWPYFRAVEAIAGQVQGRPHWGKMHSLDASAVRERYPRFDEFVALRDKLDPTGLFTNAYLDRVLGGRS
ncbi:D-arabinono-1,4-lactone oxidase [Fodinicola feengrottensis]|uniref:D-arabinono-1,4-lactone oxidase n=1 Tax=Fodinicola feengrottensis TaxID=435914 RepID=A0ABP4T6D0_9ACTN|nr:D-arabinono-1,4-lactone oxidase [Fodinicola feengrottensis]